MQAYGKKKISTYIKGHTNCAICHPEQKNMKTRARKSLERRHNVRTDEE